MALQAIERRDFETFTRCPVTIAANGGFGLADEVTGIATDIMDEDPRFIENLIHRGVFNRKTRLVRDARLATRYWQRLIATAEMTGDEGIISSIQTRIVRYASHDALDAYLTQHGLVLDGNDIDPDLYIKLERDDEYRRMIILANHGVYEDVEQTDDIPSVYANAELYNLYRGRLLRQMQQMVHYSRTDPESTILEELVEFMNIAQSEGNQQAVDDIRNAMA